MNDVCLSDTGRPGHRERCSDLSKVTQHERSQARVLVLPYLAFISKVTQRAWFDDALLIFSLCVSACVHEYTCMRWCT